MNKTYIMKDLANANNDALLVRKAYDESSWEEYAKCAHAFFPGCQLTSSDPDSVIAVYQELLYVFPDTAMFMQCCGFAAEKAGDAGMAGEIISSIRNNWNALGKPEVITACSSCRRWFSENLPEIPAVSLYDFFIEHEIQCSEEELDAIKTLGDDTEELLEKTFADVIDETPENSIALKFQKELNESTLQERCENRLALKAQMLEFFWDE